MKRNKLKPKRTMKLRQVPSIQDGVGQKNIIELALCHVAELIGLAEDTACDMHGAMNSEAILQVSGRFATLMHCARCELQKAQYAVKSFTAI